MTARLDRRRASALAVALTTAVALPAALVAACGAGAGPDERPNIVLVVADDMDYEHLGFLGNSLAHTPTLDRMAAEGMVFGNAYVPVSRCRPSLASLLSGQWPHQHGIFGNRGAVTLDPTDSLPSLLRDAGYATVLGGKYWEGDPRAMGFDASMPGDEFARSGQEELFAFLEEHASEQPIFVWWAPQMPHMPHDPPAKWRELFDLRDVPVPAWFERPRWQEFSQTEYAYAEALVLAMGAWFDDCLRELEEELARASSRDTLYAFLIDNGTANGLTSKGSPFEKGLRTPIVLSYAGRIRPGVSEALVSSVDLYPTLLDYAGVRVPERAAGIDLRPVLEGSTEPTRDVLYGAVYPREARTLEAPAGESAYAYYARTRDRKYIVYTERLGVQKNAAYRIQSDYAPPVLRDRGSEDLFDLSADPHELDNLAGPDQRAEMDALRNGLESWWRQTGGGELRLPPPR